MADILDTMTASSPFIQFPYRLETNNCTEILHLNVSHVFQLNEFSEKAQWSLSEVGEAPRGQRPSQLTANFCKTVWHNFSMHLIVGLVDYNKYHFT